MLLDASEQPGWGHFEAMRKGDQREQPWLSASPFEQRDLGAVQAAREAQGFLGQALALTPNTTRWSANASQPAGGRSATQTQASDSSSDPLWPSCGHRAELDGSTTPSTQVTIQHAQTSVIGALPPG